MLLSGEPNAPSGLPVVAAVSNKLPVLSVVAATPNKSSGFPAVAATPNKSSGLPVGAAAPNKLSGFPVGAAAPNKLSGFSVVAAILNKPAVCSPSYVSGALVGVPMLSRHAGYIGTSSGAAGCMISGCGVLCVVGPPGGVGAAGGATGCGSMWASLTYSTDFIGASSPLGYIIGASPGPYNIASSSCRICMGLEYLSFGLYAQAFKTISASLPSAFLGACIFAPLIRFVSASSRALCVIGAGYSGKNGARLSFSSRYSTTPSEYISTLDPYALPLYISGAIYVYVPFFDRPLVVFSTVRAMPKSPSL